MIRPKNVISISFRVDPESTSDYPDPHSTSQSAAPPLSIVEMDISVSSDLNLPIAHGKDKRSGTQHLISKFVSYDRFTYYLISLPCLCLLFIPKSYKEH